VGTLEGNAWSNRRLTVVLDLRLRGLWGLNWINHCFKSKKSKTNTTNKQRVMREEGVLQVLYYHWKAMQFPNARTRNVQSYGRVLGWGKDIGISRPLTDNNFCDLYRFVGKDLLSGTAVSYFNDKHDEDFEFEGFLNDVPILWNTCANDFHPFDEEVLQIEVRFAVRFSVFHFIWFNVFFFNGLFKMDGILAVVEKLKQSLNHPKAVFCIWAESKQLESP